MPTTRTHARLRSVGSKLQTLDTRSVRPPPKRADAIYLSPEWRDLVTAIKRERGARCEDCGRTDTRIFGDHVHELQDGGAPLDRANVRLLCGSCHTAKTAAARAERMARVHRPS